jgi:hypothetical protein
VVDVMGSTTFAVDYAEAIESRLVPLQAEIDHRKLGICPLCFAGPIWTNHTEYVDHLDGCVRISVWLEHEREVAADDG